MFGKNVKYFYFLFLVAAVNDITAREEQFQQYLNTSANTDTSKSVSDHNLDYYSATTTKTPTDCTKELPKSFSIGPIVNELFSNNCDSPTDEFVDINEMEFIEKGNNEGPREKNILMRRTRRKKTTKRKEDACMLISLFISSMNLYILFSFENNSQQNIFFSFF